MSKTRDKTDARYTGRRPGGDRRPAMLRAVAPLVKMYLGVAASRQWSGMNNIPLRGGVILACNHISQADPLPVSHFVYNSGRNPRFLAKDAVFRMPVLGKMIHATGQIPVYRGGADAVKSLHAAIEAVNAGGPVIFYPEGTTSKQPEHWPMKGRTGIARLALETKAPVVPLTVWGPQRIYHPVTRKLSPRPRQPVTIVAGEPVDLSRWQDAQADPETLTAMTETIMLRIRDQLAGIRGEQAPPLFDVNDKKSTETHREDS